MPSPQKNGFTLIEVMVGMLLLGILTIGMIGIWDLVAEQFFRLTLRQKAVFVLHGHMERISTLYRHSDFRDDSEIHSTPDPADLTAIIHKTGVAGDEYSNDFIQNLVIRKTSDDTVDKIDFSAGQLLYMDYQFIPDSNIIWLDYERNITAKLSWDLAALPEECNITSCYLLTLYLEYPFRFQELSNPANAAVMWNTTNTISLKTIVGRR